MSTITVEVLPDGSLVLPATMKEQFAHAEAFQVTRRDDSLILTPQGQTVERETLADYLKYLQTDDLLADTHKAKEESYALLPTTTISKTCLISSPIFAQRSC